MATIAKPRLYHSLRNGKNAGALQLDLETFKKLFQARFEQFGRLDYWTEAFGFFCVDEGEIPGTVGSNVPEYVFLSVRRHLWPINDIGPLYDESDLFDMIEFLFDHVSKPVSGHMHSFANCGMHWQAFDRAAGQAEFRDAMNLFLESYGPGYELNERGEIMELGAPGLRTLLQASPPTTDQEVHTRLRGAIDRFKRYGSTMDDRRHAVRDLADILEKLRPQAKEVLTRKDEADLFAIANKFGIRHANAEQQTDYDPAVWLSWMFYHYLASINACLHLIRRKADSAADLRIADDASVGSFS